MRWGLSWGAVGTAILGPRPQGPGLNMVGGAKRGGGGGDGGG